MIFESFQGGLRWYVTVPKGIDKPSNLQNKKENLITTPA